MGTVARFLPSVATFIIGAGRQVSGITLPWLGYSMMGFGVALLIIRFWPWRVLSKSGLQVHAQPLNDLLRLVCLRRSQTLPGKFTTQGCIMSTTSLAELEAQYHLLGQAAKIIGVDRTTLWRWVKAGKVPVARVGREVLIEKRVVEELKAGR